MEQKPLKRKLYQTTYNRRVKEYNKRHPEQRGRICITDYSPTEYEELVFLQGADFEEIFGYPDGSPEIEGMLPVVKVTNPKTNKSVHLLFRTSSEIRKLEDYAVITYSAIKKISSNPEDMKQLEYVEISKGDKFSFYFSHPIHTVRWSIRVGCISLLLGIISFIIGCISLAISLLPYEITCLKCLWNQLI